jgi:hypothetical protein
MDTSKGLVPQGEHRLFCRSRPFLTSKVATAAQLRILARPKHNGPHIGKFIWGGIIACISSLAWWSKSWFAAIFIFRYARLVVAVITFWCIYTPILPDEAKDFKRQQVAVIIPTVDPFSTSFTSTVCSILSQKPRLLVVVIGGPTALASGGQTNKLNNQLDSLSRQYPNTSIRVLGCEKANKRRQLAVGIRYVRDRKPLAGDLPVEVFVFVDDHVYWPHESFLDYLIAPFRNPNVAIVGTNKQVRRKTAAGELSLASISNAVGCLYLERHNFEIRASTATPWDHGLFVVSGRTQAHRAKLAWNEAVLECLVNEHCFFNKIGPLNSDDDNFWTRLYFQLGYCCVIQHCEEATIMTDIGQFPKLAFQLLRWARTTFRSNPSFLRTITPQFNPWTDQLWSVYAVYLTGITNFALIWDGLLIWFFVHSSHWARLGIPGLACLVGLILGSKLVKPFAHYRRHPRDIILLPLVTWLFSYIHSFVKLYALLTWHNIAWSGRNLDHDNDKNEKLRARIDDLAGAAAEKDEEYARQEAERELNVKRTVEHDQTGMDERPCCVAWRRPSLHAMEHA